MDQAQAREEADRQEGIARVVAAVSEPGAADCERCGDPIEEARRAAMPSARKCTGCQEAAERRRLQYRGE